MNRGDVILVRGGTYTPSGPIRFTSHGTAVAPIVLAADPGEHAIIDGSNMLVEKPHWGFGHVSCGGAGGL